MGSSGGGFLNDVANIGTNLLTLGSAGMENGKLVKRGGALQLIDESLGEVTGRNVARKELMNSQDAVKAEAAAREAERLNALQQKETADRMSSSAAAGLSKRKSTSSSTLGMSGTDFMASTNSDLLGL